MYPPTSTENHRTGEVSRACEAKSNLRGENARHTEAQS